jgi:hypothetical protein
MWGIHHFQQRRRCESRFRVSYRFLPQFTIIIICEYGVGQDRKDGNHRKKGLPTVLTHFYSYNNIVTIYNEKVVRDASETLNPKPYICQRGILIGESLSSQ